MTHFELELSQLKDSILEMMALAKVQLEKSKWALLANDAELAEEIMHNEKRMDSLEMTIDRDIENFLALFQPVATELRSIISMMKMNSNLERIGDYAEGIAQYVEEFNAPLDKAVIDATKIAEMFDIAVEMIGNIALAYEEEDTKLARKVYKKDKKLNKINANSSTEIAALIQGDPNSTRNLLLLFSVIRKLERVGDHIKNIAEGIIFHLEAEIFKPKKKK
jgi:phosphate transport system protein